MESHVIQLTQADIDNDKLNIRPCGQAFFPNDAIGGSTKASLGVPITIIATGITEPVRTDIPREKNCSRIRWFFRERKWVRSFVRANSLIPGDRVSIRRMGNRTYHLIPHKRKFTFIDLFAGIGGTRLAFEKAGCECVFSSEWDKFAQITYEANFGETKTKITPGIAEG